MFDLEKAIADWRRQMLAAGIKTPVPLEELEIHLREEISRQTRSGLSEPEAFNSAVKKIGQPALLKTEFSKAGGVYEFLSKRRDFGVTFSLNRTLGLIWLAWLFNIFVSSVRLPMVPSDGKSLLSFLILLSAFLGSVLLIIDSAWGRRIIRMVALLFLAVWIIQDCLVAYVASHSHDSMFMHQDSLRHVMTEQGIFLAFMLVSILILHLPEKANLKARVKF
jgi:hypothetical protein